MDGSVSADSLEHLIKTNWVKIFFWALFFVVAIISMILSITSGSVWFFQKHHIYTPSDCINGISCPFCDDKCICKFGWSGVSCNTLTDDYPFYDQFWWNLGSLDLETQGTLNLTACNASCTSNTTCKGYIWNPCNLVINETECLSICYHLVNYLFLPRPFIDVYYEKLNNTNTTGLPISQGFLYIKNGINCYGLICGYNDKYGLAFTDSLTYQYAREQSNSFLLTVDGCDTCDTWQDDGVVKMGSYRRTGRKLGRILEITELPFLQLKRILDLTGSLAKEFDSMSVACTRAEFFSGVTEFDYTYTKLGKSLNFISIDLSKQVVDFTIIPKFDTVILTAPLYGRENLPLLLSNAFNLLDDGGTMIIRAQYWTVINATVIQNKCSAAGMVKQQFVDDYLSWFTRLLYVEDDPEEEPFINGTYPNSVPFVFKNTECWNFVDEFHPPGHTGVWF